MTTEKRINPKELSDRLMNGEAPQDVVERRFASFAVRHLASKVKQIIECAELMHKLEQIEDKGEELETVHREWSGAIKALDNDEIGAMMTARKLIEGQPYRITSDSPRNVFLCMVITDVLGGTAELNHDGDPVLGKHEDMRTITVYPAKQAA
jgi:hypothetical protein